MDQQSQIIRELRQSIEELRQVIEWQRKPTKEELRQSTEERRQVIEEQSNTTNGAQPHIQVAGEQGRLANGWDAIMSIVGGKGKMTTDKNSGLEQVGPWLLLFLFLVIYFHQMEAVPRRNHGWKVADSRKCLLVEVVDKKLVGGERKRG